jgi:benzodiazapine receptor
MMTSTLALVGFVAAAWSASVSGAIFRPGAWYFEALDKPRWTPPSWLFAPAWALLFTLLGVAAWLVWREAGWSGAGGVALFVFLGHLPVNALWSALFFGLRRPDWAGVEVLVLWGTILAMVILFWGVRPLAGALLLPYLAWVGFAAALNLEIWRRNRGRIPLLAREYAPGKAGG